MYLNHNKKKIFQKFHRSIQLFLFFNVVLLCLGKITETIQTKPKQKRLWPIGFQNIWPLPAYLKGLFLCSLFLLHSALALVSFLLILKCVKVTSTLCIHSFFKPHTLSLDSQNECLLHFKVQIQFKETFVNKKEGEEEENNKGRRIIKMLITVVIINIINFRCLTSQFLITKECRVSLLQDFTWMAFQMAPSVWMRFLMSTTDLEKRLIFFQKYDRDVVCVWRFPRYLYRESLPVKSCGLVKGFIGAGQGT